MKSTMLMFSLTLTLHNEITYINDILFVILLWTPSITVYVTL